ncbi:hypothetical protein Tco_0298602 [Tanacetum coccineum]
MLNLNSDPCLESMDKPPHGAMNTYGGGYFCVFVGVMEASCEVYGDACRLGEVSISLMEFGFYDGFEAQVPLGAELRPLRDELRLLGAELRPLRNELRLLRVGARLDGTKDKPYRDELRLLWVSTRLYGTKDKPHRCEARARRLDLTMGLRRGSMGKG